MEKIIKRWYDMVRIPSVTGHEADMADYVAGELRGMNLEPHYTYFPEDAVAHARPSVWTRLESGKPGRTLMLIGHIDTVDVASGWKTDPFVPTEVGDRVYGLGAMDMKGGLAAILETMEYYTSHKDEFTGCILGCFVSDEEMLSKGTYQLVSDGITADMAIMAECRYDNVAVGFRGRYSLDVIVRGESAHTKSYPEVGKNAIIMAGRLAEGIEKLPTKTHPKLKHGTWCVRHIEGGTTSTLSVPDVCTMMVDRFVVPGEDEEMCIKQVEALAAELGLGDCVDVRLRPRSSAYMQSFAVEEDHELVVTLRGKFRDVTGKDLPCGYDPSVCDSNILAVSLGIPTVTFGPSGGGMHAANEYGVAEQVKNCAEIFRRTVAALLR